jgi:hypothetical protein
MMMQSTDRISTNERARSEMSDLMGYVMEENKTRIAERVRNHKFCLASRTRDSLVRAQ